MEMDTAMTMCPNCHMMKMGPNAIKAKMLRCDGCGGQMRELAMR